MLASLILTLSTTLENCQQEKRKKIKDKDIISIMNLLEFENYVKVLIRYLVKYYEVDSFLTSFLGLLNHK